MQRIGFIIYPGFQLISLAAAAAFEVANTAAEKPIYEVVTLSETGGRIASSQAIAVDSQPFDGKRYDTLLVCGGMETPQATPGMVAYLQRKSRSTRRIGSICTGAAILAEAGLFDGRKVTTHWLLAQELQARYPELTVEADRIFIADGPVWSSAGMAAGLDLTLAMIEEDCGPEVARAAARKLVVYHRRSGGQSQHSTLLELAPKSDRIQTVLAYAKGNLKNELSVPELAEVARLSPRQFSRAFLSETGQSPAKAIERLRVEAARYMSEQTTLPMDAIAQETGFADRERMRRAFLRAFGQPPQAIRRNA